MSDERDDKIEAAFSAWRTATETAAPSELLVSRIARATAVAPPSLAVNVWRLGRHAAVGLAVAAAVLFMVAARSVAKLEDRASVTIEAMLP